MEFDLTATLSAVTLIVSIISPVAVSVINNRHAERMARIKENESYRKEAIVNYIRNTGAAIDTKQEETFEKYHASFGEIFLYSSPELWEDIRRLDSMIWTIDHDADVSGVKKKASEIFASLCQSLANDLSGEKHKKHKRKVK